MGGYLTLGQWGKCIRGVAYKNKMHYVYAMGQSLPIVILWVLLCVNIPYNYIILYYIIVIVLGTDSVVVE